MRTAAATPSRVMSVVVETPRGSPNQYEFDVQTRGFRLSRRIHTGTLPMDFGFIPGTLGPDGAPLDALVCVENPTFPGCQIDAEPIAVLKIHHATGSAEDASERAHTEEVIVCVPASRATVGNLELEASVCDAVEAVYSAVEAMDDESVLPKLIWGSKDQAIAAIREGRRRLAHRRD